MLDGLFAQTGQKENKDFTHETSTGLIVFDVKEAAMKEETLLFPWEVGLNTFVLCDRCCTLNLVIHPLSRALGNNYFLSLKQTLDAELQTKQ